MIVLHEFNLAAVFVLFFSTVFATLLFYYVVKLFYRSHKQRLKWIMLSVFFVLYGAARTFTFFVIYPSSTFYNTFSIILHLWSEVGVGVTIFVAIKKIAYKLKDVINNRNNHKKHSI